MSLSSSSFSGSMLLGRVQDSLIDALVDTGGGGISGGGSGYGSDGGSGGGSGGGVSSSVAQWASQLRASRNPQTGSRSGSAFARCRGQQQGPTAIGPGGSRANSAELVVVDAMPLCGVPRVAWWRRVVTRLELDLVRRGKAEGEGWLGKRPRGGGYLVRGKGSERESQSWKCGAP